MIRNSLICKLINVQASMKENKEKKIKNCDEISKLIKAFPKDIAALDKRRLISKITWKKTIIQDYRFRDIIHYSSKSKKQFQKEKRSYPEENANRKVVDYKINEFRKFLSLEN